VTLLSLILVLVIVGVVMYVINVYVPMEGKIKNLLNIVVILFLVIWLLQAFGLLNYISGVLIGQ